MEQVKLAYFRGHVGKVIDKCLVCGVINITRYGWPFATMKRFSEIKEHSNHRRISATEFHLRAGETIEKALSDGVKLVVERNGNPVIIIGGAE